MPSNLRRTSDGRFRFLQNRGTRRESALVIAAALTLAVVGVAAACACRDEGAAIAWLLGTLLAELGLYLALLWGVFASIVVELDPRARCCRVLERATEAVRWQAPLTPEHLVLVARIRPFGQQRIPVTALVYTDGTAVIGPETPLGHEPAGTLLVEGRAARVGAIREEIVAALVAGG